MLWTIECNVKPKNKRARLFWMHFSLSYDHNTLIIMLVPDIHFVMCLWAYLTAVENQKNVLGQTYSKRRKPGPSFLLYMCTCVCTPCIMLVTSKNFIDNFKIWLNISSFWIVDRKRPFEHTLTLSFNLYTFIFAK